MPRGQHIPVVPVSWTQMSPNRRAGCGSPSPSPTAPCASGSPLRARGCSVRACKCGTVSRPLSWKREPSPSPARPPSGGCCCHVLDILLAVQEEAEKSAEEVLDALARYRLDDVTLELLRAEICQTLGKRFAEPGAEHDDELPGSVSAWASTGPRARFVASPRGRKREKRA